MSENKELIVERLLPVLQLTRDGEGIADMRYSKTKYDETVYIFFADGSQTDVNVSMDSGTALIRDITRAIG